VDHRHVPDLSRVRVHGALLNRSSRLELRELRQQLVNVGGSPAVIRDVDLPDVQRPSDVHWPILMTEIRQSLAASYVAIDPLMRYHRNMCSSATAALEGVLATAGGPDDEVLALVELRDRVEAALVDRVGAFDASEGWAADGAYSFACWLRARADVSRSESLQLGRFARTLRSMPATEAAVAEGKLSVAKARLLAGVINDRTRERFDEQESFLVEQIQGLDVDGTAVALRYWKRLADKDGPDPGDLTRNRASMSIGLDDRWHLAALTSTP